MSFIVMNGVARRLSLARWGRREIHSAPLFVVQQGTVIDTAKPHYLDEMGGTDSGLPGG